MSDCVVFLLPSCKSRDVPPLRTVSLHLLPPFSHLTPLPPRPNLVRPAKLPNLRISDGKVFSWSYPDSWDKPCTFFGLQFQVKVVHSGHSCNSEAYIMVTNTRTVQIRFNLHSAADFQFDHTSLSLICRLFSRAAQRHRGHEV